MSKKFNNYYSSCTLCNRACGINRLKGEIGICKSGAEMRVARAALHMWEEPIISGNVGSGTIFFSGCSLGCIYCQNKEISAESKGALVSAGELAEIMLNLELGGAANINLVTPTHFAPGIAEGIILAKEKGLRVPVVYNTGSYDATSTLRMMSGLVDIYLPDLKYYREESAKRLSFAPDYPRKAREAIAEMVRQQPIPIVEGGLMKRGVIVRLLLLPGHVAECKLNLKYLYETYGSSIYISLMSQYTPIGSLPGSLARRVSREEYRELVRYAERIGVVNGFTQEGSSARESFIPAFDNTGVLL